MAEGKKIIKGAESREKVISGVIKIADAVKTTIGPAGKHVVIANSMTGPEISRDGSIVSKSISFKDQEENIGAQIVRKAAASTEDQAGDSTSTTVALIEEMVIKGQKAIRTGANVNEIKDGMKKAQKWVTNYIAKNSIKVDGDLNKIHKVATISANNDPTIGDLIVSCMEKIGTDAEIQADYSSGIDTTIDIVQGFKLTKGWSSPQYVNSPSDAKCVMENPYVIVAGENISNFNQVGPIIEPLCKSGRPFLIVCNDMSDQVNGIFILNTLQGNIRCCVVKGVDFGDNRKNIMADLAVFTGGTYLDPENGISINQATLEDFGTANKVVVSRDSCIIYEGNEDKSVISERIETLKNRISDPDISDYDKKKYSSRLSQLAGGIGLIKVGSASEIERANLKATVEDAILASKSALAEGCSLGSGYTYFKASLELAKDKEFWKTLVDDEIEGAKILQESLPIIMRSVVENCGVSPDVVLEKIKTSKPGVGFNAKTKKYCNLEEEGVLDSSKALRVALENSVSAASMILLIDCTVVDEEDKNEDNLIK